MHINVYVCIYVYTIIDILFVHTYLHSAPPHHTPPRNCNLRMLCCPATVIVEAVVKNEDIFNLGLVLGHYARPKYGVLYVAACCSVLRCVVVCCDVVQCVVVWCSLLHCVCALVLA